MSKQVLQFAMLFIGMLLAQVICNRICLFGVAVPIVFIYFIIRLPMNMSVNWVMCLSFLLGLGVDIFSDTQGMNALAATILAASRKWVFQLYFPREDDLGNPVPSMRSLGLVVYAKYMLTAVLLYCIAVFFIQAFTLRHFEITLLRIISSSVLTFLMLLGFDSIATTRHSEKRL